MSTDGKATFQITGWDEKTDREIAGGAKLTRAKVTQSYAGDIEGTSTSEYLMSYSAQGTASFVGVEQISGTVAGKAGTFVAQHVGTFSQGKARSTWSVVEGCGTGELASLRGDGSYVAGHGEPAEVTFTCSFPPPA